MALTKDDLANAITEASGYPKTRSQELVETALELIKSRLADGEDVLISGFGKFCVKQKRERRGRNPVNFKSMILKARKVIIFKCSGQLRDKINRW